MDGENYLRKVNTTGSGRSLLTGSRSRGTNATCSARATRPGELRLPERLPQRGDHGVQQGHTQPDRQRGGQHRLRRRGPLRRRRLRRRLPVDLADCK